MGDQGTNPLWQTTDREPSASGPPRASGFIEVVVLPVLVVDDDPMTTRTVRRILGGDGHDVVVAGSCSEAAKLSGPFAVAVLDLDLGDGCGTDLARELVERGVVAKVVFYSGSDQRSVVGRARQLGPVFRKGKLDALSGLVDKVKELTGS